MVGAARTKQGGNASTSFLIVDKQGLPHAIAVTTADVTDRKGALLAFKQATDNLQPVKSILVDGGYTGQAFADAVNKLLGAQVQLAKRSELHTFAVTPKRWVERSFAWLENTDDYGKTANVSSIQAYSSSIWPSSLLYSKDRKRVLIPILNHP